MEKVKAINAELRRLTYELKRDGLYPKDEHHYDCFAVRINIRSFV